MMDNKKLEKAHEKLRRQWKLTKISLHSHGDKYTYSPNVYPRASA